MTHEMHANSLDAYREERPRLSARQQRIYDWMQERVCGLTDREIAQELHYSDMNAVRPRVTELIKLGLVEEIDSIKCAVTGKRVRRCRIKRQAEQMGLELE